MRQATPQDVERLVDLMAEFYGESDYPLNRKRAADAFNTLLSDERLGRVWIVEADSENVGYIVLTPGYSMEYGGRDAYVDDLFVQRSFRNAGLGTAALEEVRKFCQRIGVRALHLELARDNHPAQVVYRRAGFVDTDRQLLTLELAEPTHAD